MQELEKILEEIDREKKNVALSTKHTTEYALAQIRMADRIEDIIRKHMNDGWISVEDRLPEKDGFYIATIDGEIIGEDDPFVGLAEYDRGDWYDDEDYTRVIAWRPLPEPYRPERSNKE